MKILQITNTSIPAVDENTPIPLGIITRYYTHPHTHDHNTQPPYVNTTSALTLTECGYYKLVYSISATTATIDPLTITLTVNNDTQYTVTETPVAAGDVVNLTLPFVVRVTHNNPVTLTFTPSVDITSATSNLVVERV
jgi:hypothetical protein